MTEKQNQIIEIIKEKVNKATPEELQESLEFIEGLEKQNHMSGSKAQLSGRSGEKKLENGFEGAETSASNCGNPKTPDNYNKEKQKGCGRMFGGKNNNDWCCGDFLEVNVDEDGRPSGRRYFCEECLKKQSQICANCGKPKEEHLCANCGKPKEEHLCANCGHSEEDHEGINQLKELYDLPICKKFKPIQNPQEQKKAVGRMTHLKETTSEGVHCQDRESLQVAPADTHPDTSNNSTKQVEELEKGFELNNLDCDKEILADLINRAKLLKTEIEKGCGLKIMTVNGNEIKCGEFALGKRRYCNFHKNLIQRLNKIIGEKE